MQTAAMGGVLLGFATVDLSPRDNILTVWLTSAQGAADAVHTNAVTFDLDDDTTPGRALGMVCDRYVVLRLWLSTSPQSTSRPPTRTEAHHVRLAW